MSCMTKIPIATFPCLVRLSPLSSNIFTTHTVELKLNAKPMSAIVVMSKPLIKGSPSMPSPKNNALNTLIQILVCKTLLNKISRFSKSCTFNFKPIVNNMMVIPRSAICVRESLFSKPQAFSIKPAIRYPISGGSPIKRNPKPKMNAINKNKNSMRYLVV